MLVYDTKLGKKVIRTRGLEPQDVELSADEAVQHAQSYRKDFSHARRRWKEIGERVRDCRQAKMMTVRKLAELAVINESSLGAFERGERSISIDGFLAVSDALQHSIRYFTTGIDDSDGITLAEEESRLLAAFRSRGSVDRQRLLKLVEGAEAEVSG